VHAYFCWSCDTFKIIPSELISAHQSRIGCSVHKETLLTIFVVDSVVVSSSLCKIDFSEFITIQ